MTASALPRILLVDDEPQILDSLRLLLAVKNIACETAGSGAEALALLEKNAFPVMIADISMPGMSGIELLAQTQKRWPEMAVLILSAHQSVGTVVEAIKKGATDFIPKPFNIEELHLRIRNVLRQKELEQEVQELRRQVERKGNEESRIIGESGAIQDVQRQISMAARNDVVVIVYGESGTGKELVARELHAQSPRRDGPFVVVNCGALSEELLRDELFGHEVGAFTGANNAKMGLFEVAEGGTLFLDEIGELSLGVQVQLLRVLQFREFTRLGGTRTRQANVRVISATNRNLEEQVRKGAFREDLFYRINVIPIQLPPLRERREDIPLLINFFIRRFKRELDVHPMGFTPEGIEVMMDHSWPGNVRELENFIKRQLVMHNEDWIELEPLRGSLPGPQSLLNTEPETLSYKEARSRVLKRFHQGYLNRLLSHHHGNVSQAARTSGLDRKSLWRKLKKYSIDPTPFRAQPGI